MSNGRRNGVVILAAGAGKRMRSLLPKPLHPLAGIAMVEHVMRAALQLEPLRHVLVVSPQFETEAAGRIDTTDFTLVVQDPALGTGDAVRLAMPHLQDCERVVVLYADHPLIEGESLLQLVNTAETQYAKVAILTCTLDDAGPYGRVDRDQAGNPVAIVELSDDEPGLRAGRVEINSGIMALDTQWAKAELLRLPVNQRTGEYFLTDLAAVAANGAESGAWPVITVDGSPDVLVGINDRVQLAHADQLLRQRIRRHHMLAGVTFNGPETTLIDVDVTIGADTTIEPGSVIRAGTVIGSGCSIGPNALIEDSVMEDFVTVRQSTVTGAHIGSGSDVGPYSHVRAGTRIGPNVHIGNYSELKNSVIGADTRVGHFSYIGDAILGERVNVGAGSVTCNYDGVDKHETEIGSDVFIGSGSMLIAPLHIGDGARTGAGSVVTKDVSPGSVVVGVPARPIRSGSTVPSGKAEEKR